MYDYANPAIRKWSFDAKKGYDSSSVEFMTVYLFIFEFIFDMDKLAELFLQTRNKTRVHSPKQTQIE